MSNEIKLTQAADILEMSKSKLLDMYFNGVFLVHFRDGVYYTKFDYLQYWFKKYGQYFTAKTPIKKIRIHQRLKLK